LSRGWNRDSEDLFIVFIPDSGFLYRGKDNVSSSIANENLGAGQLPGGRKPFWHFICSFHYPFATAHGKPLAAIYSKNGDGRFKNASHPDQ
jgi:hypothetical protein